MTTSKKLLNIGGGVAGLVVIAAIAVAVNVILSNLGLRKDLTEEKLYTLSDGTKNILQKLDKPVALKFFFNHSNREIPVQLKSFGRRVEDLLMEYKLAAGGNIAVEKYNPEPDSDAEEWAQRYGIAGQSLGFMGPTVYIGLVVTMGGSEEVLPVLDPRTENLLEYNITRMITRVTSPEKPVIAVMSSLPVMGVERSPYPMPGQPEPKPPWFAFADLQQDFEVRKVDPTVEDIEQDVDAMVVVHPKDLSDKTLFAIDQFVLRGGRLLVFLDPLSIADRESQTMPPQMRMPQTSSNMERLLQTWGITFEDSKVVADVEAMSRLQTGGGRIEESPVWLSLRKPHMDEDDILTSNLEFVMMPYAGAFTVDAPKDVKVTRLITTSETSDMIDSMTAQFSNDGIRRSFKSGLKRLDLAVRLHGKLQTAFPEGKPDAGETEESEAETTDNEDQQEWLKESAGDSSVVLVGDVDMLFDQFCVQEINMFGFKAHQPMNDNLAFFANTIEQVAGSTDLVGIRTRGKTSRPFDVVLDLQKNAQEKYLQEETRLQQSLEESQRRLSELQAKKDSSQRFILSPRQQEEIDSFREQVVKTKRELKLVRRKLRQDIESLGVKVKVINILLMPALVSVAGLCFGFYRRKKTRA